MNKKSENQEKRLKQINIALTETELKILKKICFEQNKSMSEILRQNIFYNYIIKENC